jgi:hypothetical protein
MVALALRGPAVVGIVISDHLSDAASATMARCPVVQSIVLT